jgi:hypothetical protein
MIGLSGAHRRTPRMGLLTLAAAAALALAAPGLMPGVAGAAGSACVNEGVREAQRSTFLPDCRAYELVSAADKNGGDVIVDQSFVRSADDGSAVGYASLSEFGDSVGGGIATDYMAVRSPGSGGQGWVTHGIIPPQTALTLSAAASAFEPRYEQDFSPDLSRGVLLAWKPLTSNPFVANVANLYWRDDLRTRGGGDYTLVTGCPLCVSPLSGELLNSNFEPIMVASTPDLSRVLFESAIDLAPGAVGSAIKLYEWDAATQTVQLAGVLPNGNGALESAAGLGHGRFEHRHTISADGRRVFFTASVEGISNVYMRVDEKTTIKLNTPETGVSSTPAPAHYWDASLDGSRVFFTSPQQLTSDASIDGGVYMYDTTLPESDPNHLRYVAAGSRIIGTDARGHIAYFDTGSSLGPGQPPGIYVWNDGKLSFVAERSGEDLPRLTETTIIEKTAQVSPSGSLTFVSDLPTAANPVGSCPSSGTKACEMLYLSTPAHPGAVCVSCHADGAPSSTSVEMYAYQVSSGGASKTGHLYRYLTDDGRRVFFTTAEPLVPEDVNGRYDAYEYDVTSGTVRLVSSGVNASDSYFLETNPTGDDALFATHQQLLGWDADSNYDIYDARVNGGFPEPAPRASECAGEECRGVLTAPAPSVQFAASGLLEGAGNVKAKRPARATGKCRHGTVRKRAHGKNRCVKTKSHKTHRSRHARRGR